MLEVSLKQPLWKFVSWLPGAVLRKFFGPSKMSTLIEIHPRGTGERVIFDCGETPKITAWLTVRNHAPFTVELDRVVTELNFEGWPLGSLLNFHRISIAPGGQVEVPVEGLHGVPYGRQFMNEKDRRRCVLAVRALLVGKTGTFTCHAHSLEAGSPRFVNTNVFKPA